MSSKLESNLLACSESVGSFFGRGVIGLMRTAGKVAGGLTNGLVTVKKSVQEVHCKILDNPLREARKDLAKLDQEMQALRQTLGGLLAENAIARWDNPAYDPRVAEALNAFQDKKKRSAELTQAIEDLKKKTASAPVTITLPAEESQPEQIAVEVFDTEALVEVETLTSKEDQEDNSQSDSLQIDEAEEDDEER